MTGGTERVNHISPPHFGPSVKAYFLVHVRSLQLCTIPLVLSLIFRLCWLWRNRELVWDIVRGKFAKQLLSVFFLPNEVISYVYKGYSICSVLVNMQHHEVVQSRVSRCWAQIRLHPLIKAENDLSLTALVAGMTSNSFPRVEISLNSFLRELSRDCKKVSKSLPSNSEVSNPFDSAVCGKNKSCPFNLKESNLSFTPVQ